MSLSPTEFDSSPQLDRSYFFTFNHVALERPYSGPGLQENLTMTGVFGGGGPSSSSHNNNHDTKQGEIKKTWPKVDPESSGHWDHSEIHQGAITSLSSGEQISLF